MNDETRNQLTSPEIWQIPAYAQDMLYVDSVSGTTKAFGGTGEFELITPSPYVTVYWRDVHQGTPLAHLDWKADSLEWDGQIRIGGYVDAVHMTNPNDDSQSVVIFHLGGQPLLPHTEPYPSATDRRTKFIKADFHAGLSVNTPDGFSTWIIGKDSPLARVAYDSMLNNFRLHCFGRLAGEGSGWDTVCALPIVLESLTVFNG
jgi:hypothetical protein